MVELRKTLKKFFKWFEREDVVHWFSIGKYETKVTPQDMISEEEFQKMMNACMNSRERDETFPLRIKLKPIRRQLAQSFNLNCS